MSNKSEAARYCINATYKKENPVYAVGKNGPMLTKQSTDNLPPTEKQTPEEKKKAKQMVYAERLNAHVSGYEVLYFNYEGKKRYIETEDLMNLSQFHVDQQYSPSEDVVLANELAGTALYPMNAEGSYDRTPTSKAHDDLLISKQ